MDNRSIARINELAKKAKTVGLTVAEQKERQTLRDAYRAAFRQQFIGQMDNVDIKEKDGSIVQLKSIREKNEGKKDE